MKNEKVTIKEDVSFDPYEELAELEEFFRSDWYKQLTEVDGEYLMERIRNDVLKQEKKS